MNIKTLMQNMKFKSKQVYRLFQIKKRADIVWKDLIELHKREKFHFGQYDSDKHIVSTFTADESNTPIDFHYFVSENSLDLRVSIVKDFDIDKTTDLLILASHFNGLLTFGMVKVNLKSNYVEFYYSSHLLTYLLYPELIHEDIVQHYRITLDCFWAFNQLIESGDDPVFIFSELLNKIDNKNKEN